MDNSQKISKMPYYYRNAYANPAKKAYRDVIEKNLKSKKGIPILLIKERTETCHTEGKKSFDKTEGNQRNLGC